MKALDLLLLFVKLLISILCISSISKAQVSVTATAGTAGPTSYTTLNAAFAAINAGTHQGVISIVINANTTEPAEPVSLLKSGGTSSYSAISIMPLGNVTVNSAITPIAYRGVIQLFGADNVTIDGDDPLTNGTQNLTFKVAINSLNNIAAIRIASDSTPGLDGADNNTIKNCIIIGGRSSSISTIGSYGIKMSTSSDIRSGAFSCINTKIENNIIKRAYVGISASGNSVDHYNTGIIIKNNIIGDAVSSDNIGCIGIDIAYSANPSSGGSALIEGNDIRVGDYGSTGFSNTIAGIVIGRYNYGIKVLRNNIHDINQPAINGYGAHGIIFDEPYDNTLSYIQNNFIRDCKMVVYQTSATSTFIPTGIFITSGVTNINLDNNTIVMNTQLGSGSNFSSFCVNASVSGVTFASIQNNIFINNHSSSNAYGIYTAATSNISASTVNKNNYYCPNANVGYYNGAIKTSLASWRSATGKDLNSLNINPNFNSNTDLHIVDGSSSYLESAGANIVTVTNDYDGQVRPGPTSIFGEGTSYDIGADEFDGFKPNNCTYTPPAGHITASVTNYCGTSGTTILTANGAASGVGVTRVWKTASVSGGPYISIPTETNLVYTPTGVLETTYYVLETTFNCGSSSKVVISNEIQFNIIPNYTASLQSLNNILCAGDTTVISAFPRGNGETYSWSNGALTNEITVAPSNITDYTVWVTSVAGCVASATSTVKVYSTPTVTINLENDSLCVGVDANFASTTIMQMDTIFKADFNNGNNGFSITSNSTLGNPELAKWTLRPSGYIYSNYASYSMNTVFFSNDSTQFIMSNSDAQGEGGITEEILTSTAINTNGLKSLYLKYFDSYYYQDYIYRDGFVEVSTNGVNWTIINSFWRMVEKYNSSQFFANVINLNNYINKDTLYIRFRYSAEFGFSWAIDNVSIYGEKNLTYSWSGPDMFTSTTKDFIIDSAVIANSGVYTLQVLNDFGCNFVDSVVLSVDAKPGLAMPDYADMCDTFQNLLLNTATPVGGVYSGIGVSQVNSDYYYNSNNGSSIIKYIYTTSGGCRDTIQKSITVNTSSKWFLDNDGDGKGDKNNQLNACIPPNGYVADSTDCDDNNSNIHAPIVYYLDNDKDGYGSMIDSSSFCSLVPPINYVTNKLDCNDYDSLINPLKVWYEDLDGDLFGNVSVKIISCIKPVGYVSDSTDCNDSSAVFSPATIWYLDADGDGFGDINFDSVSCFAPIGYVFRNIQSNLNQQINYVLDNTDCDDSNPEIFPKVWFLDIDGDGFGNINIDTVSCSQPIGYVADSTDCNDGDININPLTVWFNDADGDGYGDISSSDTGCVSGLSNPVLNSNDCDDNDVNTGVATTVYYADLDGDGFINNADSVASCSQPVGYVLASSSFGNDCDDNNDTLFISGTYFIDMDGDGYDNGMTTICRGSSIPAGYLSSTAGSDCDDNDGQVTIATEYFYSDADGDMFIVADSVLACSAPSGYISLSSALGSDCDDNDDQVTAATEYFYADSDGDMYVVADSVLACSAPTGYISLTNALGSDCNDNDDQVTFATEYFYADADGDMYVVADSILACSAPSGYISLSSALGSDCDDNDDQVHTGTADATITVDNSMDPMVMLDGPAGNLTYTWYVEGVEVGNAASFDSTFTTDGTYEVVLVATGNCGVTDSDIVSVTISNTSVKALANNVSVAVVPNPANAFVNVTVVGVKAAVVQVLNVNGQVVSEHKANFNTVNTLTINTTDLVNGVYFVKVTSEEVNSNNRIIIAR